MSVIDFEQMDVVGGKNGVSTVLIVRYFAN